jgi:hypothetical protein
LLRALSHRGYYVFPAVFGSEHVEYNWFRPVIFESPSPQVLF